MSCQELEEREIETERESAWVHAYVHGHLDNLLKLVQLDRKLQAFCNKKLFKINR